MKLTRDKAFWQQLFAKRIPGYKIVFVKKRPWLKWLLLLFLIAIPSYITWAWHHYGKLTDDQNQLLDFQKLHNKDFYKASYVYDVKGQPIGRFFYEARDFIKLRETPELVKQAFIAAEDGNFYRYRINGIDLSFGHPGVDPLAIARAGGGNIINWIYAPWANRSGASTIEQQSVRFLYENNVAEFKNRSQTLTRKIREARIAIKLNEIYSKDEILEGFLNLPYFGYGANGIVEAWRVYFNKDLRRDPVTIREVAIIAGLHKSPERFSPVFHRPLRPKISADADDLTINKLEREYEVAIAKETARLQRARKRFNYVLTEMLKEGFISQKDYENSQFKENEPFDMDMINFTPIRKKRFVYVNRMIKEFLMFNGISDEEITKYAGLKIYSTIDSDLQQILTEEVNKQLAELNKELPANNPLEASFVVINAKTGEIRAISGGHEDVSQMQFNRALSRRSPGSAIKPFVYAAALEEGGTLDDPICNCPIRMRGGNGKMWAPQNFPEDNPVHRGNIPRAIGFIRSVNLPTIQMILGVEYGMDKFIALAHRCGIWANRNVLKDSEGLIWFKYLSSLEKYGLDDVDEGLVPKLPTAIGASGVSLVELAAGYGVFARGGTYIRPTLIKEVKDPDNHTWLTFNKPEEKRAMPEDVAKKIAIMGRAVTKFGTLKISMRGIEQQVAGKTGTANNSTDALTVTWNPEYVIAIRFGHDRLQPIELPQYMKRVSGRSDMQVTGGWLAGPVARRAWDRIYKDRPKVAFSEDIEAGTTELIEKYGNKY
ncbi:MAG: transglycosylase domain-containing protein [Patescibacteria group bacterium]|mgnify:CR=1 FL=1